MSPTIGSMVCRQMAHVPACGLSHLSRHLLLRWLDQLPVHHLSHRLLRWLHQLLRDGGCISCFTQVLGGLSLWQVPSLWHSRRHHHQLLGYQDHQRPGRHRQLPSQHPVAGPHQQRLGHHHQQLSQHLVE